MLDVSTTDDILTEAIDLADPRLYLNRELSWLAFNERVVALAADHRQLLLERCKFLAIASNNLDEFFMVRVAAMQEALVAGRRPSTPDRMARDEVLDAVSERVRRMIATQSLIWNDDLRPALDDAAVRVRGVHDVPASARAELDQRFERQVLPVLTPLAVGPGLPFPYISGLSLNLGLTVRDPATDETRFARVKVPPGLPRMFPIGEHLVLLEDLMQLHIGRLFPGMEVEYCTPFRVTRDADFDISDDSDDLLGAVEDQLRQRRFGHVVRLEVASDAPAQLIETLSAAMSIGERDIYRVDGMLDFTALWAIADLDRPDLRDAEWRPVTPVRLRAQDTDQQIDMFAAIRGGDILVHHPYDDFQTSVERFITQAVDDPNVLAIKQTMYRTSGDSPLVSALVRAAEEGKQTVCLVEVKARFDEERNIRWARDLERSGVHVVYGIPGLKTHAKLALVVRREGDSVRRYVHIGTGNYHPRTARLYTDFGLFSCDDALTEDVADLFNYLTGFGRPPDYRRILVAPTHLRDALIEQIERVVEAHREGTPGRVVLKMNSLVDGPCIEAIYRASQAGVPVDLIVRGICALRPGVPGVSDNVRVVSVVGRFLEHSRVFAFFSGDDTRVFIGSADMMVRNLDHRVEVVAPVLDAACRREITTTLDLALLDTVLGWSLDAEGEWSPIAPCDGVLPLNSQQTLMGRARAN